MEKSRNTMGVSHVHSFCDKYHGFGCCYHASRYRARARARQKGAFWRGVLAAVPRHNHNNNNNDDDDDDDDNNNNNTSSSNNNNNKQKSKNQQQQQQQQTEI